MELGQEWTKSAAAFSWSLRNRKLEVVIPEPQSVVSHWLVMGAGRERTSCRDGTEGELGRIHWWGRGPQIDGQMDRRPSVQEQAK